MLIAPLMTPILGIAAAMVMGWSRRAFLLLLTVCIAASASVALAWVLVLVSDVPRGIIIPSEVIARTDPGTEELIVALAAGIAGAYVQIQRSEISLLPGAAIGVSLVPPLCAAGILLYYGEMDDAYEAALLFATNLGAIILSAYAVYVYSSRSAFRVRLHKRVVGFSAGLIAITGFLGLIAAQLIASTVNRYHETRAEAALAAVIRDWSDPVSVELLRVDVRPRRNFAEVWLIVDLPIEAQYQIASVADMLPDSLRDTPLRKPVLEVLGPEYTVVFRYQTRIAAQIELGTDTVSPAPAASIGD